MSPTVITIHFQFFHVISYVVAIATVTSQYFDNHKTLHDVHFTASNVTIHTKDNMHCEHESLKLYKSNNTKIVVMY